ncbi:MAG TPA: heterodisulfide reductase-related iron-sulfur binding cluster [bacterium]|nr:heterodisulfide reductase-related iron-sulfur binding cluster [bacterium]
MEQAHREYYWHIHPHWVMYVFLVISMAVFAYGIYRKIMLWKNMKPAEERFTDIFKRAFNMISEVLLQRRVRNRILPGTFHSLIFWSFLMLMLATAILTVEIDLTKPLFGVKFFYGSFYLLISALADIAGFLFIIGLSIAIIRRYVLKPKTLESNWENAYMLILLLFIGVGGFALEGLRIAHVGDQWAAYTPFGLAMSKLMAAVPESMVAPLYQVTWWTHAGATFLLMGSLPYTKFFHFLLIPANYMFSNTKPKGTLQRDDLEELFSRDDLEEFSLGHSSAKDLTWKNALDYEACIECGRCEEVCPVAQCGYPLVPRKVMKSLKESMYKAQKQMDEAKAKAKESSEADGAQAPEELEILPFIGDVLDEHGIWLCRTCRACMEVCPAMIEHIDQLTDVRRSEVMMNGRLPTDAKNALKALETRGNPFGPQQGRLSWIKGDMPDILGEGEETDVLFWLGCVANYDQAKQHIAENMFAIMKEAGIKFAMLGDEEMCCGDPARSLGDENVFQAMGKQQVEILNSRKFNTIVTICPHCLNSLKNEFQQFGGNYQVVHHTEFLLGLVKEGKIKLSENVNNKVVYHDPCYLGRYANVFNEPRTLMQTIKGIDVVEPKNMKINSFCCGAGGGNYFMDMDLDVPGDERLNVRRAKELAGTGANTVAVSCPYCMQMLEDGIKLIEMEDKLKLKDISTIVLEAMGIKTGKEIPVQETAQVEEGEKVES